jgi:hypothetical protein
MKRSVCAGVFLLCFVLSVNGIAQSSNAALGGTVADSSGAVIPGVEITATNTGTGIARVRRSAMSRGHTVSQVCKQEHKVSAALSGFQTQTYNTVTLGVSQQVRLNFAMQVGGLSQTVEVSVAADTLLSTSSASVGNVLPDYKVRDLPVRLGSVLDLIATTPGAVRQGDTQGAFSGQRSTATNVTRDGVNIMDGRYEFGAYAAVFSSPDLVEEVRVITGLRCRDLARFGPGTDGDALGNQSVPRQRLLDKQQFRAERQYLVQQL